MTREQWMGAAREGYNITSFAFEEMDIDVFGDTAVIHARYSQVASWESEQPLERVPADGRVGARHATAGRSSPATRRSSAELAYLE